MFYIFDKVSTANGSQFFVYKGTKKDSTPTTDEKFVETDPTLSWDVVDDEFAVYLIGETTIGLKNIEKMSLDELKTLLLRKITTDYSVAVAQISAPYSPEEQSTWSYQVTEAQTVLSGDESEFIMQLAEARSEDPKELSKKILLKNAQFEEAKGKVFIEYTKQYTQINKAQEVKDLPIISEQDAVALFPMASTKFSSSEEPKQEEGYTSISTEQLAAYEIQARENGWIK
jgi:tRNA G10  N-methylase Trm11